METVLGVVLLTILMLVVGLAGQQLHINRKNKRRREMRLITREYLNSRVEGKNWLVLNGTFVQEQHAAAVSLHQSVMGEG